MASMLLVQIVLLTVVIGSLCVYLVTQTVSSNLRQYEANHLEQLGQEIAQDALQMMIDRYRDVSFARGLIETELQHSDAATQRNVLERLQKNLHSFSWLGIVATNGRVEVGTQTLLEGKNLTGRDWFEGGLKQPVFIGGAHPGTLLGNYLKNSDGAPLYLLDIAMPIRDTHGNVVRVLGSHLNWKMIEEMIRNNIDKHLITQGLAATIINRKGQILFDTAGQVGTINPQTIQTNGISDVTWLDQKQYFTIRTDVVGNAPFDHLGWSIIVRKPMADVLEKLASMRHQVIIGSFIVGLLFSLLGLLAVRRVTRPLQKLVTYLDAFAANKPLPSDASLIGGTLEVNKLDDAFINMAQQVRAQTESLRETQLEIVRTLGRASEFRDNETGNHVTRMSLCCERLALLVGYSPENAEILRMASQMHDVGKIGIPDHILLKPGRFTDEERKIMEQHCEIGGRILSGQNNSTLIVLARSLALTHHEKWDGTGYPNKLKGEEIPIGGRITAICDVFDALLSERPYKQPWPLEKVISFFEEQSGKHFDPALAALLLAHIQDFKTILEQYRDPTEATALPL